MFSACATKSYYKLAFALMNIKWQKIINKVFKFFKKFP